MHKPSVSYSGDHQKNMTSSGLFCGWSQQLPRSLLLDGMCSRSLSSCQAVNRSWQEAVRSYVENECKKMRKAVFAGLCFDDNATVKCVRAAWAQPLSDVPLGVYALRETSSLDGSFDDDEQRDDEEGVWAALVKRGEFEFETKARNATRCGASLVIIVGDGDDLVRMKSTSPGKLAANFCSPTFFVPRNHGDRMRRDGRIRISPVDLEEENYNLRSLSALRQKRILLKCTPCVDFFGWTDCLQWTLPPGLWRGINMQRFLALFLRRPSTPSLHTSHHFAAFEGASALVDDFKHDLFETEGVFGRETPSFAFRVEHISLCDSCSVNEIEDEKVMELARTLEFFYGSQGDEVDFSGADVPLLRAVVASGIRQRCPMKPRRCLDVSANSLLGNTLRGVAAFAPLLRGLSVLRMWGCDLQDEGVQALVTALLLSSASSHSSRVNSLNLHTLDLGHNAISDVGAAALVQLLRQEDRCSPLRWLNLSHNDVGDEGALALAAALDNSRRRRCSLEFLDVSKNSRISSSAMRRLNYCAANSSCNVVNRSGLIARDETDSTLDLSSSGLTQSRLEDVVRLLDPVELRLTKLNLRGNSFNDDAIRRIIDAVHHFVVLEDLDISDNAHSARAVERFAVSLKNSFPRLLRLAVTVEDDDEGAYDAGCAIGEALRQRARGLLELMVPWSQDRANNHRRLIPLSDCAGQVCNRSIGSFSAVVVSRFFFETRARLDFSGNRVCHKWAVDALLSSFRSVCLLGSLSRLELARRAASLVLSQRTSATSVVGAPLTPVVGEEEEWYLHRTSRNLGDADCVLIASELSKPNSALAGISLSANTSLTGAGVVILASSLRAQSSHAIRLRSLDLRGTRTCLADPKAVEALADAVAVHSGLEELNLRQSGLTNEGAIEIADAVRAAGGLDSRLAKLDVSANPNLTEVGRRALREVTGGTALDVRF